MAEPRCAHYQLAHAVLPMLMFRDLQLFNTLWGLEDPLPVLAKIAARTRSVCEEVGENSELDEAALRVHKRRLGRGWCLVIEMPAPLEVTEAFMVGVLRLGDDAELRYFTLEYSPRRPAQTMVGEWMDPERHVNYGDGPEPDVDAFVAKIASMIAT